jgi:TonB family protein
MKIPYSYRQHFFSPVFLCSFVGHIAVFSTGSFFTQAAHFSVEQAPSSMEVLILEDKPKITPEKEALKVLTAFESEAAVKQAKLRKEPEKKKVQKTVYIPPTRGAMQQPKPDALKNPAPVYPLYAREKGWEGLVILNVLVQKDGRTGQVSVVKSSGHEILDQAAVSSVQKWRFLPARVGKLKFASSLQIPIRFVLEDNASGQSAR